MDVQKRIEELLIAHKALSPREAMLQLAREVKAACVAECEKLMKLYIHHPNKFLPHHADAADDCIKVIEREVKV